MSSVVCSYTAVLYALQFLCVCEFNMSDNFISHSAISPSCLSLRDEVVSAIESCGGCDNIASVRAGTQPACLRRVPYTCAQSWEEKVKIECPSWWKSDSCGTR